MDSRQELEILYEISLAIGHGLELSAMLKQAVGTIMRQLSCKAAVVLKYESSDFESSHKESSSNQAVLNWDALYCIPKSASAASDFQAVIEEFQLPRNTVELEEQERSAERGDLPCSTVLNGSVYYGFFLPQFGFLILKRVNSPLSRTLLLSLNTLMSKLAYSAVACLHDAQLKKQIEAAQAANVAKGQFLANMSHEIRTPMNGVIGMLDITLETELQPRQRDHLRQARLSAQHLMEIINLILDISKIEAKKFSLRPEPTDFFEFIGELIKSHMPHALSKQLNLLYDVDPKLPRWVEIDSTRLRQIMSNLIGNALKFTDRGSVKLVVSAVHRAEIDCSDECTHWARIDVEDSGVGIPAGHLSKIFNAFEQVDSKTTRQFEGTGLGLAITRELVEIMGGTITVESELDQGTRFSVMLPLKSIAAPSMSSYEAPILTASSYRVLVVDDESLNRSVIHHMLEILGVACEAKVSAPEGLLALRTAREEGRPFNLLLLDANMPGMDGYAMAAEVLREKLLCPAQIQVLSSSAFAGEDVRDPHSFSDYQGLCQQGCPICNGELTLCQKFQRQTLTKPITLSDLRQLLFRQEAGALQSLKENDGQSLLTGQRLSILIAEDNAINQEVLLALLEKYQVLCTVANDGLEAVKRACKERFDLVFMDIMMPKMDGLEATRKIRKHEQQQQWPRVPIIALTAKAMKGDREEYLEQGMDGYVAKPIHAELLFKEMERLLSQHYGSSSVFDDAAVGSTYSDLDAWLDTGEATEQEAALPIASRPVLDGAVGAINVDQQLFDWDRAVRQLGAEESLLALFLSRFLTDLPSAEQRVKNALAQRDAQLLKMEVHTLKSLCATLCLEQARAGFAALEQASGDPADNWAALELQVGAVFEHLQQVRPMLDEKLKKNHSDV
ncbi:response regulator [Halorhodospira abdelmalekii]|uniref:response regulator n=1 Tax=Halorhodospira abdelmalekii TaxID=421629 RepID=UPI00190829E9